MDRKILVGGYDFEQKVHRGIAFWGKALIRSLSENNDVYLLTSAVPHEEEKIALLNIIKNLENPEKLGKKQKLLALLRSKIPLKKRPILVENEFYGENRFEDKLQFLNFVKGFYNIKSFYDITAVQSRLFPKRPVKLKADGFDLVITTSPMNLRCNVPLVQTLHDVIPLTCFNTNDRSDVFYTILKHALRNSTKVLCISEFSKEECLKFFPQFEDKLVVTYQPIPVYAEEKTLAEDELIQKAILEKFGLRRKEFLLYIGVIEKRKNVKRLIEAFLAVYDKLKIPLVLAGALGYGKEEVERYLSDFPDKIKYLGYVTNIEKLVLLKTARAFLFPSYSEGFGLPPLEAMLMETPVLTSNRSALPEVCGDAALYVDPFSTKELAEGIVEIATNEKLQNELTEKGKKRVEEFSFEKFKSRIRKALQEI
ncbi:glycosyltransferase family 4 protein [Thermovibrio ammonificans]